MNKILKAQTDCRQMQKGEIVQTIFDNREIESIHQFLNPTYENLIPFEKLLNINKAFNVVDRGILEDKSFLVYADVDCDGVSSGTIMYRYLKNFIESVEIYINNGKKHGVADFDIENCKADIVIVVDSVNEYECYEPFFKANKQVIVLDHHIIPQSLVENPNDLLTIVSSANHYNNPQLSGAGVVWKFCSYIDYMYLTNYAQNLVDLATCGIIGDMCDMSVQENRFICSLGFKNLQNKGIKGIIGNYKFDSQSVSFSIAPLINASNRLNKNDLALKLFLTDDEKEIKSLAKQLKSLKDEQNKIVDEIMTECDSQAQLQIENKVMTFVVNNSSNASVSGLLGNKLIEKYKRPVLVLSNTSVGYFGSGRGYGTEDFNKLVQETGLAIPAGHENAFGVTIKHEDFDNFCAAINQELADYDFKIEEIADVQVDLAQISIGLINDFKTINQISGTGFKSISVLITGITDYEVSSMSGGKHLKIVAGDITLIKWNFCGDFAEFDGRPLTVIGGLDINYFGKKLTKQVIINEYKLGD